MPSHAIPTTTARSRTRRVSRYVRRARTTRSAVAASPTASTASASGLRGAGTDGTRPGQWIIEIPSARIAQAPRTSATSSGRTASGPRRADSVPRARIAQPTGRVAPPVKATTPFDPTRMPGVDAPWRQSSAAIIENARPARTARPSDWSAPRTVRASAAPIAIVAAKPTPTKWIQASIWTWCAPSTSSAMPGSTASATVSTSAAGRRTATETGIGTDPPAFERGVSRPGEARLR